MRTPVRPIRSGLAGLSKQAGGEKLGADLDGGVPHGLVVAGVQEKTGGPRPPVSHQRGEVDQ